MADEKVWGELDGGCGKPSCWRCVGEEMNSLATNDGGGDGTERSG